MSVGQSCVCMCWSVCLLCACVCQSVCVVCVHVCGSVCLVCGSVCLVCACVSVGLHCVCMCVGRSALSVHVCWSVCLVCACVLVGLPCVGRPALCVHLSISLLCVHVSLNREMIVCTHFWTCIYILIKYTFFYVTGTHSHKCRLCKLCKFIWNKIEPTCSSSFAWGGRECNFLFSSAPLKYWKASCSKLAPPPPHTHTQYNTTQVQSSS